MPGSPRGEMCGTSQSATGCFAVTTHSPASSGLGTTLPLIYVWCRYLPSLGSQCCLLPVFMLQNHLAKRLPLIFSVYAPKPPGNSLPSGGHHCPSPVFMVRGGAPLTSSHYKRLVTKFTLSHSQCPLSSTVHFQCLCSQTPLH